MKRLAILEPHLSGHHANYLRQVVVGALECGIPVVVGTTRGWAEHPELDVLSSDGVEIADLEVNAIGPRGDALKRLALVANQWQYWRSFSEFARQNLVEDDVIFLPYLDYCLYSAALAGSPFGNIKWCGVGMRITAHHASEGLPGALRGPSNFARMALLKRLLRIRTFAKLFCIDPLLSTARQIPGSLRPKIAYIRDPASDIDTCDRPEALGALRLDARFHHILVYGVITARKGIQFLLTLLDEPDFPDSTRVIVCGRLDDECRVMIEASRARSPKARAALILFDQWADPAIESYLFSMADVVWAAYIGHNSMSGVVVQAAMRSRPIFATPAGLIGWYAREYAIGVVLDPRNPSAAASAVAQFMNNPQMRSLAGEAAHATFGEHTAENFRTSLFEHLRPMCT